MQTFIQETIQDILKTNTTFNNVTFVLPSNRAGVFVKQALKNEGVVGFLPEILTIEGFTEQVSSIRKIDSIQLLFYFYKTYKSQESNPDTFDVFSSWALTVLQDFNEIDQHLVNAEEVFIYIRDVQRLKKWSVKGTFQETELMKDHFAFTERLNEYYTAFYKFLLDNKIGYQGCLYREATKRLEDFLKNTKDRKFFFIGFNALNKAEEYILKTMLSEGNTEVYWDIDEAFLYSNHQAGNFIRKYKTSWNYYKNNEIKTIGNWFSQPKNIRVIGAAKNVSQQKYAGELLTQFPNYNNTALVLADESLLPITLNSLPENVSSINITMGYPLKDIPSTSLFLSIFQLFISQEKLQKKEAKVFYYKEVIKLIKAPLLYRLLLKDNNSISDEIVTTIFKENRTFVDKSYIASFLQEISENKKDLLLSLVTEFKTIDDFLVRILNLIEAVKNDVEGLEKEFLFRYYTVFNQLQNLQIEFGYFSDIKTLYQFFKQLINSENLSFQGEPLQGLQLMGMLETRLLDFKNIIVTSVNEGVFPANNKQISFIPFDAKVAYGLPTYREKDAIFSYHFFRLIQRAENVFLLYNTESDTFGGGEKSRFITQLELLKENIQHTIVSPKISANTTEKKEIKKNDAIAETLKELAGKGISPSALTNYLYNPIAFYQQKVLKIREFDDLEEEVAFNTLGTVVHETLRELYEPMRGNYLSKSDVEEMKGKVNQLSHKYFSEYFKNGDVSTGKNRLIFEVAVRFVTNFLNQEIELLADENNELKILELEKNYEAFVTVEGIDFPIKIHGQVDRVDQLNGVTRIIDYKTGLVNETDLKIGGADHIMDFKYSKAIQVLLYAYMFSESEVVSTPLEAGIISFKRLKSGFMKLNFSEKYRGKDHLVTPERITDFIAQIKELLLEIYNPEIAFIEPSELPF
ncbi:PD-(D/E)XK nuclease family protein [Tenacibaculum agarivorans]|uniref:PD-(D/E)XK nuclease family protein n=1 Tax=Tenacibaculum agarivorans TaxID=1908389 RepID=UPI00094BBEB5|nr:PD-(D/E)XK nuclease family protein [Tenacibaculum agarivorans]